MMFDVVEDERVKGPDPSGGRKAISLNEAAGWGARHPFLCRSCTPAPFSPGMLHNLLCVILSFSLTFLFPALKLAGYSLHSLIT